MWSKTEEGTVFYTGKSFDSFLCSKSKTIIFLATALRVNEYSQECHYFMCVSISSLDFKLNEL